MEKGIILYRSKYGATRKYAQWLSEITGFSCCETGKTPLKQVLEYHTVILCGGIYASGIAGLSFLKKNWGVLKEKRLAVFCVGASPNEEAAFQQLREHNFQEQLAAVPCFYGRGAWDESAMTFPDRTLCRLLQKSVAKKAPADYEPWEAALMCAEGKKCDWTEKRYLEPLTTYLQKTGE